MEHANTSQRGLTAEELKSQMFQTMQATGVLHKLKGQLRQNMINELRGTQGKKKVRLDQSQHSDLIAATIREKGTKPWTQQVLDNLVLHHIKQSHYHYTLSLFQQESGLTRYSTSLTDELLTRLGLQPQDLEVNDITSSSEDSSLPHSSTPKQPGSRENLTLWSLLSKLSALSIKRDFTVDEKENLASEEIEKMKPMTLSEKLKAIDDDMKMSYRRKQRDPNITVSTLASAIKRAEEDADRRAKVSFDEWKASELSKVRLEEAKRSKDAISARINSLESEYQSRRNELSAREKAAVERLTVHREQLERDMHEQRQSLLRELDQIRLREDVLHQKEQFVTQMENMKLREIELLKAQQKVAGQGTKPTMQSTGTKPDLERNPSFVSTLADSLRRSHDGSQVITTKEMTEIMKEVDSKSVEIEKLKAEVAALKNALDTKQHHEGKSLKDENSLLKDHLHRLERQVESLKTENIGKEHNLQSQDSEELKREVNNLRRDREEQNLRQHQLEEMILQMQRALKESRDTVHSATAQPPLYIPATYPTAPPSGQSSNPMPEASSYRSTQKDLLREYETLEPPVLPVNDWDSKYSTGIRHNIMQRLKELDEESDAVAQQYNRYLKKNYKESLLSPKKTNASIRKQERPSPTKPHFLTKEPDFDLLPVGKTSHTMAPDFLRERSPLTRPEAKISETVVAKQTPSVAEKQPVTFDSHHPIEKVLETDKISSRQEQPSPAEDIVGEKAETPTSTHDSPGSSKATSYSSSPSSFNPVQPATNFHRDQVAKDDLPAVERLEDVVDEPEVVEQVSEALEVSRKSVESETSSTWGALDLRTDPLENTDQLSADREMTHDEAVGDYMEDIPTRKLPSAQQPTPVLPKSTGFTETTTQNAAPTAPGSQIDGAASKSSSSVLEDSLKLSMEDLDVKSGASSPKSKSSLSSEEPHIDTVRKMDPHAEERESPPSKLPPVPATRKLPSLPPIAPREVDAVPSSKEDSIFSVPHSVGGSSWKPAEKSDSMSVSEVSEVDEEIASRSSTSKDEDVPLFKVQEERTTTTVDAQRLKDAEKSGPPSKSAPLAERPGVGIDQDVSLSQFSSVSADLPPIHLPFSKEIPELKSFDDDVISAVLKWEDENRPSLNFDEDDEEADGGVQVGVQEDEDHQPAALDTHIHEDLLEDNVVVFEQSASQISFESDRSRKSKENESDFSW